MSVLKTSWLEIPLRYRQPVEGQPATLGLADKLNALEKEGARVLEYQIVHVAADYWLAIVKIAEDKRQGGPTYAPHAAPAGQGR